MSPETNKLLEEMAAKLGVTVEHLWGVLVYQAPISATYCAIVTLTSSLVGLAMVYSSYRAIKGWKGVEPESPAAPIVMIVGGVMVLLAVISLLISGEMILAGFFNPEYWALERVTHLAMGR